MAAPAQVAVVSAHHAFSAARAQLRGSGEPTLDTMKAILYNCSSDSELQKLASTGAVVYFGTVKPNDIVYIPAGFVTAYATANNEPVSLVREAVLARTPGASERLAALRDASVKGSSSEASLTKVLSALSCKKLRAS